MMTFRAASNALYGSCYCPDCHPEAFPVLTHERQNEGHTAVRFGDHVGPMVYTIMVDGVDRSKQVIEAMPGADGWAWAFSRNVDGKTHRCPCGAGPCQFVLFGMVQVRGERRVTA